MVRRQRSQRDLNLESKQEHEEPDGGFRKLYMELRRENERLREALTETTLRLAQLKVELERATQRQERFAERPALLELERFERRALERKAAELEEELKVPGACDGQWPEPTLPSTSQLTPPCVLGLV